MEATSDVARCPLVRGSPAVDMGGYLAHGNDRGDGSAASPKNKQARDGKFSRLSCSIRRAQLLQVLLRGL